MTSVDNATADSTNTLLGMRSRQTACRYQNLSSDLLGERISRDHHCDIVSTAVTQGEIQEVLAGCLRGIAFVQDRFDYLVVDHIGEPIGAQQELIAVLNEMMMNVRFDFVLPRSQSLRQNISQSTNDVIIRAVDPLVY